MNIGELLHFSLEHLFAKIIKVLFTWFFGSFWLLASFREYFRGVLSYLQSFDPQYSLIFLHLFVIGYVHLISLISWEMQTLWGSPYYIGLLNLSAHFWQWMPMGERFRGFKGIWFYALVSFLSICLSCSCILACSIAWIIHYINPHKRDCHQLPKWGRLKVHGAPMCGFGN